MLSMPLTKLDARNPVSSGLNSGSNDIEFYLDLPVTLPTTDDYLDDSFFPKIKSYEIWSLDGSYGMNY
jgi:hypothetical protein